MKITPKLIRETPNIQHRWVSVFSAFDGQARKPGFIEYCPDLDYVKIHRDNPNDPDLVLLPHGEHWRSCANSVFALFT